MFSMPGRIKRARIGAKISQQKLAESIQVHRSAVSQWESENGTRPNVEHLVKIAVLTQVQFEWLATGRGAFRSSDKEEQVALRLEDFAQNEIETRILQMVRKLSRKKLQAVCVVLELLA